MMGHTPVSTRTDTRCPFTWLFRPTRVVAPSVRPTGLVAPEVIVKPTKGQIDDIMEQSEARSEADERVLITTLTKKMSEDLSEYLLEQGVRCRYLHSKIGRAHV